jgi:hypothetical protein
LLLSSLRTGFQAISRQGSRVALFNIAFFCTLFVAVLAAQFLCPSPFYMDEPSTDHLVTLKENWPMLFGGILVTNLVLSAFVVVTIPGVVLFPLSVLILLYRAVLWGVLLYPLPRWQFLATLPTVILEGEAYVIAAVAGTTVGMAWMNPNWLYKDQTVSRQNAFRTTVKEGTRMYGVVVLLLLAAALVETATLLCT